MKLTHWILRSGDISDGGNRRHTERDTELPDVIAKPAVGYGPRSRMMSLECGDDVSHHRGSAVAVVIHGPVENAASKVGCDPAGDHGGDGSYCGQLDVAIRLREEVVYRISREEGMARERGRDHAHLLWCRLERISLDNYICSLALGTLQSGPI